MKPFEFNPTFLLSIVSGKFYSVPKYQRSYAWTLEMIHDFWADMERAISDDREHFMGNIVLSAESGDATHSIVDGQQRIVTTTLLLCALRDELRAGAQDEAAEAVGNYVTQLDIKTFKKSARVRMNPDDNPFYFERFIKNGNIAASRESHTLMEAAYNFFKQTLSDIRSQQPATWLGRFGEFTKFLEQQARIVVVEAPTDADAFTVFETLNDRGADLTISDLLKNLLFSRSKKEIDAVQQLWIETRTIIDELKPRTNMMTFLRHFWSSRHGATRERDLYREIKNSVQSQADAVKFAQEIKADAALYQAILSPSDDFWKAYSPTAKIAVAVLDRFALEQIRPLLLAIYRHFSPVEAQKATKALVNWSVRGLVCGVIGGGKAESYFCKAAIDIRSGKIKTVSQLQIEFKDFVPNDAMFRESFDRYRTTNNSFGRYLLYGLEKKLKGETEPELVPNQNVDEVNLEHVLPQRAKVADWPQFSVDTIPLFAYRLGNMTLLSKGPNGKIGNKPWAKKKPALSKSKLKLNEVFGLSVDWSSAEIESRQSTFSQVAPSVWPL